MTNGFSEGILDSLIRALVQGNYYHRTRFVTRSTFITRLVNCSTRSTYLPTRSTCLPTRSTRLSIRSICLSTRSTCSTLCSSFRFSVKTVFVKTYVEISVISILSTTKLLHFLRF